MIEVIELALLGAMGAAFSVIGLSLRATLRRCLAELEGVKAELGSIRVQLGTPQNAVYRLVVGRGEAQGVEPQGVESPSGIEDRPN